MDKRVFKNVKLFMENKKDGDDLFDRLNTSVNIILERPFIKYLMCAILVRSLISTLMVSWTD